MEINLTSFNVNISTDRMHGSKERFEFKDEVSFEGTNF